MEATLARARPRLFHVEYTLRNGADGTLDVIGTDFFDAIDVALDLFGDALRSCSVSTT